MQNELIIIIGPTCSGKTNLALILAEKISAEIISADSMQIYKFMDIGTAKPTSRELNRIPYHLINIITPDILYSAGEFKKDAEKIINDINNRGKKIIITGGTGLFIKTITHGIFTSPARNDRIREELNKIVKEKGLNVLYEQLQEVDPVTASKIHINDPLRIIRALEVYRLTNIPISKLQSENTVQSKYKFKIFGLKPEREELYSRINKRVDEMVGKGILNEIKFLIEKGYDKNSPGLQGIGYKELMDYIEGKYTFEQAVNLIKRNTRRYAKRQFTWFNHLSSVIWFEIKKECNYNEIAEKIIAQIG